MPLITPYTFEQVATAIKTELQDSSNLTYVPNNAVYVLKSRSEQETIPEFTSYMIRLFAPDTGFLVKIPRIGNYFRNIYSVGVELWVKSGARAGNRLLTGNITANKGIWEFFSDVNGILEHNRLSNALDPYPGTNIQGITQLYVAERQLEGVGFTWVGNQDNLQ